MVTAIEIVSPPPAARAPRARAARPRSSKPRASKKHIQLTTKNVLKLGLAVAIVAALAANFFAISFAGLALILAGGALYLTTCVVQIPEPSSEQLQASNNEPILAVAERTEGIAQEFIF